MPTATSLSPFLIRRRGPGHRHDDAKRVLDIVDVLWCGWRRDGSATAPVAAPVTQAPEPAGPAHAVPVDAIPSNAAESLRAFIASDLRAYCPNPTELEMPDEMFVVNEPRVQVDLGFAQCDWRLTTNPYCDACLYELRTYDYRDGGFGLSTKVLR